MEARCRRTATSAGTQLLLREPSLRRIYAEGEQRGLLGKVEPHATSLMFAMREGVWFSKGSTANIKITTAEDLRLFRGWVLAGRDEKCDWE